MTELLRGFTGVDSAGPSPTWAKVAVGVVVTVFVLRQLEQYGLLPRWRRKRRDRDGER